MTASQMSGREIREARIARGHTAKAAAAIAGVCLRTWYRWELDEGPANAAVVELYLLKTTPTAQQIRDLQRTRARTP